MFNNLIVSITKKVYNTKFKEIFLRVAEIISILVILFVADIAGFVYAMIKGNTSTLPLCGAVMLFCIGVFAFICYKGSKIPPECRNTERKK